MITKDEHIILSKHLIKLINWDRVYDNCASISKQKFYKDDIISSVKKMISSYPNFDISEKGRIESYTLLFSTRKGTFNDYMYFVSGNQNDIHTWYIKKSIFLERMKYYDDRAYNIVWFNMKEYLKRYKLDKLISNLK